VTGLTDNSAATSLSMEPVIEGGCGRRLPDSSKQLGIVYFGLTLLPSGWLERNGG